MTKPILFLLLFSLNLFAIEANDRILPYTKQFTINIKSEKKYHKMWASESVVLDAAGDRNIIRLFKMPSSEKERDYCALTLSVAKCDRPNEKSNILGFDSSCVMEKKDEVLMTFSKLSDCHLALGALTLAYKYKNQSVQIFKYFNVEALPERGVASLPPKEE
ncbi:MAG: hypothetical protein VX642_03330 [Bdellovibrionota bacterium]|nr:hypothetical protein [Bdellovibrionota bacterium]